MRAGTGMMVAGVALLALAACTDDIARTAPPSGVVFTYPAAGQIDVPLGAPVIVTFSDPVAPGAIPACIGTAGAFCVVGPEGPVSAAMAGDGNTVSLAAGGLLPGTAYDVYVRSTLSPGAQNLPAEGPLFHFTTRSTQSRAAPPQLIAINGGPPSDPTAFRPLFETSTIQLVFSEPLDPRTIVLAPGAIELLDPAGAAVPALLVSDDIHISIDPTGDLTPGITYQLKIGSQLADRGGQPIAPTTIPLTPKATGAASPIRELLRPRMTGEPAPPSHTGSERNAVRVAHPLIGTASTQLLPDVLVAELGDPRALDGPIAFTIRRGQRLRSLPLDVKLGGELPSGLATGAITIELLTDAGGRIYRNPHQRADQVPDNARAPLIADLSMDLAVYAVDATGNAVLSQTVLGVQGSGVVIADHGVLDLEAVIAIDLDLLGVGVAPTNLLLELITDPAAQVDVDGTPPTLVAALPAAGDTLPVDAGVDLIFSRPIDLARARAGGIRLETAAGAAVVAVIESHGAAVVVRPLAALTYATDYRVVLADVADTAGHPLATATPLAFSTPPLVATEVPLTAVTVYPGAPCALTASPGHCVAGADTDDAYHPFSLPANRPLLVRFTRPPLASSIRHGTECNAGSVRIEALDATGACTAAVAGTLTAHDRTLSFVPDQPWLPDQHYRLTLVSGADKTCADGEICGVVAASFDPLSGSSAGNPGDPNNPSDAGGPDLVIDFTGAPASAATLAVTETTPLTDSNGSGFVDAGEPTPDRNRVALRITGTSGAITEAHFPSADCLPDTPDNEACMYVSGAIPTELQPLAHDCPLPDGTTAPSCIPVALSPQAMYATSVPLHATAVFQSSTIALDTNTGMLVLRIREPAAGPATGYLIDDHGTPTVVLSLEVYLDAPDLQILLSHDLHSKPLRVDLRGPLQFTPDGRIAIAVANQADIPLTVNIAGLGLAGSVMMVIPRGEMTLRLTSPAIRGGLR